MTTTSVPVVRTMPVFDTVRAEAAQLFRRPDLRVVALIWALQIVGFGYVLAFTVYSAGMGQMGNASADLLVPEVMPENFHRTPLASLPMYGGPVMIILGALVGTSDYRWGTLSTIVARQSNRTLFFFGRAGLVTAWSFLVALMTLGLALITSSTLAIIAERQIVLPAAGDVLAGLLATWLVITVWSIVGFALGVLLRRPLAAIGVGLLWGLMVELLVRQLGNFLEPVSMVVPYVLSGATSSIAVGMGNPGTGPAVTMGVVPGEGLVHGIVVLMVWLAVFVSSSYFVFRRRDILGSA